MVALVLFVVASVGVIQFQHGRTVGSAPFAGFLKARAIPVVMPSMDAYGTSGEVKVRFVLPGEPLEYPLQIEGDPTGLAYTWLRFGDSVAVGAPKPLAGAILDGPSKPGFYKVVLVKGREQRVIGGLAVAVLAPFEDKVGGVLNGYRIGTYLSERVAGKRPPPEGFMEIMPGDLNLMITKHLRVRDFVTHDNQKSWPRYAAVSPRLLDKLELVVAEIERWGEGQIQVELDVKSGFRSPDHNRTIRRAARDSRHQYGDAADVAVDVNGDGKFSAGDMNMLGLAVEIVEIKHPHLAGGLGMYLRARTPYVHIDTRGKKSRWRG
ncbi:MAG TPA: D-Ala-D-Ala carboxypeptidase family metallohydrolase [Gemmatimonadaceae bacterium]|nr:D-Ala-D-Ala carboxypeptidase family metallohydrolase [Gemmatimonadaceae bacterium]